MCIRDREYRGQLSVLRQGVQFYARGIEGNSKGKKFLKKILTIQGVFSIMTDVYKRQLDYLESTLDSLSRVTSEKEVAEIRRELTAAGVLRAPKGGKAVSYTHLDVYKRQAERIRRHNGGPPPGPPILILAGRATTACSFGKSVLI